MNQSPVCPNCGRTLPAGAPAGLCPSCLFDQAAGGTAGGAKAKEPEFEPLPESEVQELFPQLKILGLIGAGGMGAVYRARQPALDRQVALKLLRPRAVAGVSFEERFGREARALARLSHPNIVAVHEFGSVKGFHYFLMEYVDGADLRQLERAGRLSPREALQIIPQICEALQYAHDEGVVHRDIKPENVLVDRKGRVKIADFGLAKILGLEGESLRLTVDGQVMGTPHYMAPEQVERPLAVDHRADIYSLGVVFYEMLTGELPLGKFAPPSRKVEVDVRLDEVVLRALENDPARRYQRASEVKSEVETITNAPGLGAGQGQTEGSRLPGHLSRTALAGLVWAALFLIMNLIWLGPLIEVDDSRGLPNTGVWRLGLTVLLAVFGLTAPLGTTILGWTALAQIRRSEGRVYGLGLAFLNGVLFPFLLLNGVVAMVLLRGVSWLAGAFPPAATPGVGAVLTGIFLAIVCLGIDYYLGRLIWRAVVGEGGVEARRRLSPRRQLAWGFGGLLAVAAAVMLTGLLAGGPLNVFGAAGPGVAARDPVSGALTVRLPDGGSMELLAVSDIDSADNGWWLPDGTGLTNVMLTVENLGQAQAPNAQLKNLILRHEGLPPDAALPRIEFVPHSAYSAGGRVLRDGKVLPGALPIRVALPEDLRKTRIRVGLDWGPWSLAARHDPTQQGSTQIRHPNDPQWHSVIHNVSENLGQAQVTLMLKPDDLRWKTRLIAVDTNGVERTHASGSGTPVGSMEAWTYVFRDLPLAAVQEFQVQVRPVHWFEFRQVALRPDGPMPRRAPPSFTEAHEFTITDLLDLDSGRVRDFPAGEGGDTGNVLIGVVDDILWAQRNGFDVAAGAGELQTLDLVCAVLDNADWEGLSPEAMMDRWYAGQFLPRSLKPTAEGELPSTYAFRTREGAMGMLQLLAFAGDRPGVTLRVKLVKNAASHGFERSPISAERLAESPKLRFLAWQDEWEAQGADSAFHPDGSEIGAGLEYHVLKSLYPTRCGKATTDGGAEQPRFLHLWFSHPAFDLQSFGEVRFLDRNGQPLALGGGGATGCRVRAADPDHEDLAWLIYTLSPGDGEELPEDLTVRLRYTTGELQNQREVTSDYRGMMTLAGNSQLSGIGQDDRGQAFVTLAIGPEHYASNRFGVTAWTRDGRQLAPSGLQSMGGEKAFVVNRFEFDVPLSDVERFQIGSRPVRSAEWPLGHLRNLNP